MFCVHKRLWNQKKKKPKDYSTETLCADQMKFQLLLYYSDVEFILFSYAFRLKYYTDTLICYYLYDEA